MEKGQLLPGRHSLVATRNVNTDSPWPISTNPNALFNNLRLTDCNLRILLWKPIRASTAAPSYFEPEKLQWNPNDPIRADVFKDGGAPHTTILPSCSIGWRPACIPLRMAGRRKPNDACLDRHRHPIPR